MTVSTENSRDTFTFDGVTTVFPFTFRINEEDKANIKLYEDGVLMSASLYTIAVNANGVGGTITFSSAPGAVSPDNTTGVAIRQLPYTQGFDIRDGEGFDEEAVENAFDKTTILTQQLKDLIARSLSLPLASSISPNVDAPSTDKQVMYYDLATQTIKWTTAEALYAASGAGNGDIVCSTPSVVDSNLVSFDGTTGNIVKDSGIQIPATASKNFFPVRVNSGATGLEYQDTSPSELTLDNAGAITPVNGFHTIDTYSNASSDDVESIATSGVANGTKVTFMLADGGRTCNFVNSASIELFGGTDFNLDAADKSITLIRNGSKWTEVGRNTGSGGYTQVNSSEFTPVIATTHSLTHGLGVTPTEFWVNFRCNADDATPGYVAGDVVNIPTTPSPGGQSDGNSLYANSTGVYFKSSAQYLGTIEVTKKDASAAGAGLTLAKWRGTIYARVAN